MFVVRLMFVVEQKAPFTKVRKRNKLSYFDRDYCIFCLVLHADRVHSATQQKVFCCETEYFLLPSRKSYHVPPFL